MALDPDTAAFSVIAVVLLGTALLTVLTHRLFYSALFLAATLLGVGAVFLTLHAEFLFAIQLLVYAGAVVTLLLFAIMFTHGSTQEEN